MWDVLLDTPLWLHGTIIRDWITTKSIALLDSAYCKEYARVLLWHAFKRANVVLKPNAWLTDHNSERFALWATKREISVGQVALASSLPVFPAISLVQNMSISLTSVKLKASPVIVTLVGTVCRCIRNAELFDCTDFQAVGVFLNGIHTTVERLVLISCKMQSGDELCTMSFPNLTVLITEGFRAEVWVDAIAGNSPLLQRLNVASTKPAYSPGLPCTLKRVALNVPGIRFDTAGKYFSLPSLEALSLTSFDHYSAAAMSAMLNGTPLLSALMLQHASSLGDDTLKAIARTALQLRRFHIGSCPDVTAVGVARLLVQCAQLIEFGVYGVDFDLSHHAFLRALRASTALRSLDVGNNTLDAEVVQAIASSPNLEELGARRVRTPSSTIGLDHVARHAQGLHTVRISSCNVAFTDLACRLWKERFPCVKLERHSRVSEFWAEMDIPVTPHADLNPNEMDPVDEND
jgi:hypothetical protein